MAKPLNCVSRVASSSCDSANAFVVSPSIVVTFACRLSVIPEHACDYAGNCAPVACRHYVGFHSSYNYGWMDAYTVNGTALINLPARTKYLYSIYYVMTTLASVGYGDITPKNSHGEQAQGASVTLRCLMHGLLVVHARVPACTAEVIFATALEILGNIYVAVLVGNVLAILTNFNRTSEKHRERLEGIQSLMVQFPLPRHIRRQLRKWVVRGSLTSVHSPVTWFVSPPSHPLS